VGCYQRARARNPSLHGKLKLRIVVNEAGAVQSVHGEPGGSADDPALVACIGDAMKEAKFPKPGGTATIVVPLVFRR
jgi:outer membrane biosynthesis protein TonB